MYVFSYSHEQKILVKEIFDELNNPNRPCHVPCWADFDLVAGDVWHDKIMEQIRKGDGLILFLSPQSVKSKYCREEWELAIQRKKKLIPVMIETCGIPAELEKYHYLDISPDMYLYNLSKKVEFESRMRDPNFEERMRQADLPTGLPDQYRRDWACAMKKAISGV